MTVVIGFVALLVLAIFLLVWCAYELLKTERQQRISAREEQTRIEREQRQAERDLRAITRAALAEMLKAARESGGATLEQPDDGNEP